MVATLATLPQGIVQLILEHLDPSDQGKAACVNRLCCAAVEELAPALYFFSKKGDAARVAELLLKASVRRGIDSLHAAGEWRAFRREAATAAAARRGHDAIVKLLIEAGASPGVPDSLGATPLMRAALRGHTQVLARLLEAGATVDAADGQANTALLLAIKSHSTAAVEMLLDGGASVSRRNANGQTALMLACTRRAFAEATWDRVLAATISVGQVDAAAYDGTTALMAAAACNTRALEILLAAGADPHAADSKGWTALLLAIRSQAAAAVEMLLDGGASVGRRNAKGQTALMLACSQSTFAEATWDRVLAATISVGQVDAAAHDGTTALMAAAVASNTRALEILLAAGAEPHAADGKGCTALLFAAAAGDAAAVEALLAAGAAVNAADGSGSRALILAAEGSLEGYSERLTIMDMLITAGAACTADAPGYPALLPFAARGDVLGINSLIEAGAAVNAATEKGTRALAVAAKNGHAAAVKRLLAGGAAAAAVGEFPVEWSYYDKTTALGYACGEFADHACMDVVAQLVAAGGAVDDHERLRALDVAASHGDLETATMLLAGGIDFGLEDAGHIVPLVSAAKGGFLEIVEGIIEANSYVGVWGGDPWSPLMYAANRGRANVVDCLLAAGATISAKDVREMRKQPYDGDYGTFPNHILDKLLLAGAEEMRPAKLVWAIDHGRGAAVEQLLAMGVAVNPPQEGSSDFFRGRTALMAAAEAGIPRLLKRLLELGASIHATDEDGDTALDIARECGHKRVTAALEAAEAAAAGEG